MVLEAIRDALEPDGISVEALGDATALEREHQLDDFDLILLDVQLPAASGDVVAEVMRHRRRVTAPIVLLSSLSEAELAARTRAAGVDGYILKERGVDEFVDEVRAWLDGRRTRPARSPGT